uniref:chitinase n=1 Tax=Hypocrella siamensis TaxID=696354 RepID=A0A0N7HV81_9HYPO
MWTILLIALALLQAAELCFASPESLPSSSRRSLYARRFEVSRDNDPTRALSTLSAREDYTCGPGRPCSNKACCGESGNCSYGASYCGKGCTSNCDSVAECGKDSKDGKTTCPLNTCCSQYGFCGTTKEFCGKGCQSNCDEKPSPPIGSTKDKTLSKVIGYYEAWNARSSCHMTSPRDLPLAALTHLNYAFAYLDPTSFSIKTMDAATPTSLFDDISDLKTTNPDLKIFVSIGGWTFSDNNTYTQPIFGDIARDPSNRQLFANQLVAFLIYYGFDGVDLDWEYPGAPDRGGKKEDTKNYVELVQTIRATFDESQRGFAITFTAPSSYWYLKWFDLAGMMKHCDWVNLMSYDLHGAWDSTNPIGAIVQGHTNLTEIKLATELFWRAKIPAHKIALGFGFYGRAFTLANPGCSTPGCPFSAGAKPGVCTKTSGYLAYYEVQDILKKNPDIKIVHDKESAVKYFTFDTDQWISYDDKDTFKQKIEWANGVGFSGSLIWASDLAHAALTGKGVLNLNSALSKKTLLASQKTKEDLSSYLRKDCYVLEDSLTACKSGDDQVGYDKAGRPKDYKPICCPKGSGLTKCQWRGGTGGTNAGRDCNGQCHAGEVKITMSGYGGSPGESSETAHCTRGQKAFCCGIGVFNDALGQCSWSDGVGSSCKSDQQKIAYVWDKTGWGTVFKHGNEFCCPKNEPPPLSDCRWVGKGDCADNTCGGSEVTLFTDDRGDSFSGCSWGRKRALCCTPNMQTLQTETCDLDLCKLFENRLACDDEAGDYDSESYSEAGYDATEEGYTAWVRRSSYVTGDGKILWTYEDSGMPELNKRHIESDAGSAVPGKPRHTILSLVEFTGSALYRGKNLVVTSRPYWPGLKSLKGDGSDTLQLRGGYSLLRDTCSSTAMKFIPAAEFPKKGFQLEHVREINMIYSFVKSLLSGKLFSGADMKNKLDPLAVYKGWNKVYDVSLPQIGRVIRDAADYTRPVTPNDRIFETIGSYAYREGVTFLPGPLNLIKRTLMEGKSPLGSPQNFEKLLGRVSRLGDEENMKIVLTAMQGTVAIFNYLNDAMLHRAFTKAGLTLTNEMQHADEFIPELKGILAAWKEWEPDYYEVVTSKATKWLVDRGGLIAGKFVNTVNNPAAVKLASEAAQLVAQAGQIRSPLSP